MKGSPRSVKDFAKESRRLLKRRAEGANEMREDNVALSCFVLYAGCVFRSALAGCRSGFRYVTRGLRWTPKPQAPG